MRGSCSPQVLHVHVDLPRLPDRLRLDPQPGGRGQRQPHRAEVAQDAEGAEAAEGDLPLAGNEGEEEKKLPILMLCSYAMHPDSRCHPFIDKSLIVIPNFQGSSSSVNLFNLFISVLQDCRQRPDVRHPVHLQRAARVPRLLAHLLHHGRPVLRRQVLQVRRRERHPPRHRRRQ